MKDKMKKNDLVEVLAPAGSFSSLKSGINAGADALYIGGKLFGARAYADNLDTQDMIRAIDYVHLHNKKLYLTINTLLKDEEILGQLYNYVFPFYKEGIDAIIVQDIGVLSFLRKEFPNLNIHASTQMTLTNKYGASLLKQLGASRIVTSRELQLEEIKDIHDNVDIEIESFVHGALCYSYSGMCLMSSMIGTRSANRGRCAGPCRKEYSVYKNNEMIKRDKYVLSLKDICTLDILPAIIDQGVTSLKIEGRMKKPEYTAATVSLYKKYALMYKENKDNYKVDKKDIEMLERLYSRSGYVKGFYDTYNSKNLISIDDPSYNTNDEEALSLIKKEFIDVDKKIPIMANLVAKKGSPLILDLISKDNLYKVVVEGSIVEKAKTNPVTSELFVKQIQKTGSTNFVFENHSDIILDVDNDIFVSVKELNELRRQAIIKLEAIMLSSYKKDCKYKETDKIDSKNNKKTNKNVGSESFYKTNVYLHTKEQITAMKTFLNPENSKNIANLYIDYSLVKQESLTKKDFDFFKNFNIALYYAFPSIFRANIAKDYETNFHTLENLPFDGYLLKTLEQYEFIKNKTNKPYIFDTSIYTFNSFSKKVFIEQFRAKHISLPFELNQKELFKVDYSGDEMVVYGYTKVMVSASCIHKTLQGCDKSKQTTNSLFIKDKKNAEFKTKLHCDYCYNTIYNSVPLALLDIKKDIQKMSISYIRLEFTFEDKLEVLRVLDLFNTTYYNNKTNDSFFSHTKGHYKRGVE